MVYCETNIMLCYCQEDAFTRLIINMNQFYYKNDDITCERSLVRTKYKIFYLIIMITLYQV